MEDKTEKQAIAFIRSIANHCDVCFRRSDDNCRDCVSMKAKRILNEIVRDESTNNGNAVAKPFAYRMMEIVNSIREFKNDFIPSGAIIVRSSCSPQLKHFTLRRMVELGILECETRTKQKRGKMRFYRIADGYKDM